MWKSDGHGGKGVSRHFRKSLWKETETQTRYFKGNSPSLCKGCTHPNESKHLCSDSRIWNKGRTKSTWVLIRGPGSPSHTLKGDKEKEVRPLVSVWLYAGNTVCSCKDLAEENTHLLQALPFPTLARLGAPALTQRSQAPQNMSSNLKRVLAGLIQEGNESLSSWLNQLNSYKVYDEWNIQLKQFPKKNLTKSSS